MVEQERINLNLIVFRVPAAVRTARAAFLGASAERIVHDLLDGPGASATLGAAAETAIDLPGRARQLARRAQNGANVVVGQDIAGANDHGERAGSVSDAALFDSEGPAPMQKEKPLF